MSLIALETPEIVTSSDSPLAQKLLTICPNQLVLKSLTAMGSIVGLLAKSVWNMMPLITSLFIIFINVIIKYKLEMMFNGFKNHIIQRLAKPSQRLLISTKLRINYIPQRYFSNNQQQREEDSKNEHENVEKLIQEQIKAEQDFFLPQ